MRSGPFLVFVLLFSAASIQAQQSPTPTPASRDAQAVVILQKSLAAQLGTTTVNDVTLTGSANWIAGSDNETGSVTLKATAVGKGRVDLSLSDGQRSEVIDASQATPAGSWCGSDGAWHAMVAHNLMSDPSWFFPAFLISRALSKSSYAISPMEAETQDGIAVEHVQVYQVPNFSGSGAMLLQSLSQIDIYLNSTTLLPLSIAFNAHPDNNALVDIPIGIKFSNYQTVQGISVPYHVQKYIQNGLALDLTVSSLQLNSGLSASDFQVQ
ncbi:MAG TPA: hypothetical protein VJN90_03410 [Candidatus Acidoferrales bacterium]|nr:hypothetical protein [Candidatus Acidoferrales bacterium]